MKIPYVPAIFFLIPLGVGVEAGLLALANWQDNRYHQRLAEQAEFAARPTLRLAGTWLPERTFALTNQPNPANPEAEVGWRILTPLQTASGTLVIDRGYTRPVLTATGEPDFTPFMPSPTTAVLDVLPQPYPTRHGWLRGPDTTTHPRLLAFLNPALIVSETTATYYLSRTAAPPLAAALPPLASPAKHLSYRMQWLGLAVAFPLLCLYGWLKNRRPRPRR